MKLNEEAKVLIRNKLFNMKIEAWIKNEQRRIDVDVIDLENNVVSGNHHSYAPWIGDAKSENDKWNNSNIKRRNDISLDEISLLQFKKEIGGNELIIGIK